MIKIDRLNFKYNDSQNPILVDINLKFKPGEFVLILGPSGSGKSTLVRTINALIPNFYGGRISGSVNVQDMNVFTTPTRIMAGKVGMIFQNPENQLFMSDVESEIAFGMENLNFSKKIMKKRMEEILNSFGITHLREKSIASLSGGEKQKVAIASVIAMNPEILILDEPTAELDPRSAEEILKDPKDRESIAEHILEDTAFGDARRLRAYLPARFRPSRRYPLLVVHDGTKEPWSEEYGSSNIPQIN